MHKELASGRWFSLSIVEQLANIGSEVERAISWRKKNDPQLSQQAFERALELLDLSLQQSGLGKGLKEISRLREVLCDYFAGENEYQTTENSICGYFSPYFYAARKNR